MSATCERGRELMVGRLYGELSPAELDELDEHLQACAACREEAAALAETRAQVRPSLSLEPPRGSRARIMAAVARETAHAAVTATRPQPVSSLERLQAWIRGRWALPTLATVGVAAGVLLASRVLVDPNKTAELGGREKPRHVVSDTELPERLAPATPEVSAPGAPTSSGERSEALDHVAAPRAKAPESKDGVRAARPGRVEGLGSVGAGTGKGAGPRGGKMAEEKLAPAPRPAKRAHAADGFLEPFDGEGVAPATAAPAAPAAPAVAPSRSYATPPGGWAAKPKARAEAEADPAGSAEATKMEKRPADDELSRDRAAASGGSVRQGPSQAPAPSARSAPQPAAEVAAPPSAGAAAPPSAPASAPARRAKAAAPSDAAAAARAPDDLVARIERLYSEGKLSEAAVGYRDLVKRFPQDSRARSWRSRIESLSARGF